MAKISSHFHVSVRCFDKNPFGLAENTAFHFQGFHSGLAAGSQGTQNCVKLEAISESKIDECPTNGQPENPAFVPSHYIRTWSAMAGQPASEITPTSFPV